MPVQRMPNRSAGMLASGEPEYFQAWLTVGSVRVTFGVPLSSALSKISCFRPLPRPTGAVGPGSTVSSMTVAVAFVATRTA